MVAIAALHQKLDVVVDRLDNISAVANMALPLLQRIATGIERLVGRNDESYVGRDNSTHSQLAIVVAVFS